MLFGVEEVLFGVEEVLYSMVVPPQPTPLAGCEREVVVPSRRA